MADIIDVMYRLRDMAGQSADTLREAIKDAQAVLDKLDCFANDAEEGAELIGASDLHPNCNANIPKRSGLERKAAE
jgi:hypothetical protein